MKKITFIGLGVMGFPHGRASLEQRVQGDGL